MLPTGFTEGVPARTVMELLGHSTIQLTMNTYTHVMPETQRDAVAKLDRWFDGHQDQGDEHDQDDTDQTDDETA
ncbi:hypothetical protein BCD49_38100 [Pseudofrankia sp. EUN1h]|nr:hypothetical protein BCD49_38100 [Pseudofrankia sp. EUN1h]